MKILTPNEKFTGVSASVNFINGQGETDDPHLIGWFRDHGYTVVAPDSPKLDAEAPAVDPPKPEPEPEPEPEQGVKPTPRKTKKT